MTSSASFMNRKHMNFSLSIWSGLCPRQFEQSTKKEKRAETSSQRLRMYSTCILCTRAITLLIMSEVQLDIYLQNYYSSGTHRRLTSTNWRVHSDIRAIGQVAVYTHIKRKLSIAFSLFFLHNFDFAGTLWGNSL